MEEIKEINGVISVYGPFEAYDYYIHERGSSTVKKMVIPSARRSVQCVGCRPMDIVKFFHNGLLGEFKVVKVV